MQSRYTFLAMVQIVPVPEINFILLIAHDKWWNMKTEETLNRSFPTGASPYRIPRYEQKLIFPSTVCCRTPDISPSAVFITGQSDSLTVSVTSCVVWALVFPVRLSAKHTSATKLIFKNIVHFDYVLFLLFPHSRNLYSTLLSNQIETVLLYVSSTLMHCFFNCKYCFVFWLMITEPIVLYVT